ncbi:MAG: SEC-C metal-binding domain-containing protein [Planctomycetota bacterium]|nr:SEC-C metal-binding domain-containing protein [Planctomycetota bacterium]
MTAPESPALPWEALTHTEGDIPWPALEASADALAAHPMLLDRLTDRYDEFMTDPDARRSYECLYIPAILAMAAPRMDGPARRRAADWLVEALLDAEANEDDLQLDLLDAACGAVGPEVLAGILDSIPTRVGPGDVTASQWNLMALAARDDGAALRPRVVETCMKVLRMAEDGQADVYSAAGAAWTLAALKHAEARPLMARLYHRTKDIVVGDALDALDDRAEELPKRCWELPLKEVLQEDWEDLRQWYAQRDTEGDESDAEMDADDGESFDDEDDAEDNERRVHGVAERFLDSPAAAALPEAVREDAPFIAHELLDRALTYEGALPEDLTERALRSVLLEIVPRKVSADREFFEHVAPAAQALVNWLGSEGILQGAPALAEKVGHWGDQIVQNSQDSGRWGMAKGLFMRAGAEGVDPTDQTAFQRFVREMNRRTVAMHEALEESPEEEDDILQLPGETIVRSQPKIGRNAPCPCGSGKKYKKCCGR